MTKCQELNMDKVAARWREQEKQLNLLFDKILGDGHMQLELPFQELVGG